MRNIRLLIEYDGSPFAGWQRQLHKPTVQGAIEQSIARIEGRPLALYGASRTDAGVHARGQVAHFHSLRPLPEDKWRDALNFHLPKEVRILEAREVPRAFHARADAVSKLYEYRVLNRRVQSSLDRRVYFYPGPLRWDKIKKALPRFLGERDFRGFQGAGAEVETTVRCVYRFELFEEGNGFFRFEIEGSGFLKQMVRSIVGTALEVGFSGNGKRDLESIDAIFTSGDRRLAGHTAPADGLTLARVDYAGWEASDVSR